MPLQRKGPQQETEAAFNAPCLAAWHQRILMHCWHSGCLPLCTSNIKEGFSMSEKLSLWQS